MYGRARSSIPARRRGEPLSRPRINYGRNRIRRYMLPTENFLNRTSRSYGPPRRQRSPAWARDRRIFQRGNMLNKDEEENIDKQETAPAPPAEEKELENILNVKSIDLNIADNVDKHHTGDYKITRDRQSGGKSMDAELVIRRGEEFEMTIRFNRPFDKKIDDINLTFKIGERPVPKSNSHASFKLEEGNDTSYKPDNWGARIVNKKGNKMTVGVFVPADCVIGEWEFVVKTIVEGADGKSTSYRYEHPGDITILLNPWCIDDMVYLSTDKLLDEYILNDGGALFYGNYKQIGSRGWNFGQFADGILEISLHLLRKAFGGCIDGNMGDPVFIARAMSRIINSNDDDGVLIGNWSGNYKGGTRPTAWAGSIKILEQYEKTGKPVSFGQCWVFSGVLTTVCRAIGLPCRSVTNFKSAHDTNKSCTIDKFFYIDDEGDLTDGRSGDSTWNFHVWNEVWMARPDLPFGYDGWQVIDATPQELSDRVYCLGPSPVTAVKKGDINIGHDTGFVFSEVNADAVDWLEYNGDDFYVMSVNQDKVGKKISTKKPTGKGYEGRLTIFSDDPNRADLTSSYKYEEGTEEERDAVEKATKLSNANEKQYVADSSITLHLEDKDGVMVGDDFSYGVTVKNSDRKPKTVKISMVISSISYDGETIDKLAHKHFGEQVIGGNKEQTMTIDVKNDDYVGKLFDHFAMKITAFCIVNEEQRAHVQYDDFRLRRPDLELEAPPTCKLTDTLAIKVFFTNPTKTPLTNCKLMVEGSLELTDDNDIQDGVLVFPDIPGKSKWETTLRVKPKATSWNKSERDLFLSFDCEELPDIVGLHTLEIE